MFFFSKSTFLKNSFKNAITVSNSFDQDQTRRIVGPDIAKCYQQATLVGTELNKHVDMRTFLMF